MHSEFLIVLIIVLPISVDTKVTQKSTFSLSTPSKAPKTSVRLTTISTTEDESFVNGTTTEIPTKSNLTKAKAVFVIAFISATVLIILLIILIAFNVKSPKLERRERPNDIRPSTR